jgi:drug/metabolite transporter (DMT)-like permease
MMAASISLFSILNAAIKSLSAEYSLFELVFFRQFFALPVVLALLWRSGGASLLRTYMLKTHILRGVLGTLGTVGFFYGLARLPLADAIAIGFATPVLITALSMPILGEQVGWRRWSAVAAGFAGVMVIVRPGAGVVDVTALVIIVACTAVAVHMLLSRRLSRTEHSATIALYFTLASTAAAALLLPFGWVTPSLGDLALFAVLGLASGVALLLATHAYRLAAAAVVAPFEYIHILWATALGFLFWGDVPGWNVAMGAAIVIASGLYILHREVRLGRAAATAAKLPARV